MTMTVIDIAASFLKRSKKKVLEFIERHEKPRSTELLRAQQGFPKDDKNLRAIAVVTNKSKTKKFSTALIVFADYS